MRWLRLPSGRQLPVITWVDGRYSSRGLRGSDSTRTANMIWLREGQVFDCHRVCDIWRACQRIPIISIEGTGTWMNPTGLAEDP